MDPLTSQDVFSKVDSGDMPGFAALFAEDARMVFGNAAPIYGPTAVETWAKGFVSAIDTIEHDVHREWHIGMTTIVHLTVTYRLLDGSDVSLPVGSIWETGPDGKLSSYDVLVDPTPLTNRLAA